MKGPLEKLIALITIALLVVPLTALAAMSSSNYKIQFDSINIGGGSSSSTNYGLEDTVGEVATGRSESTNYRLNAGFQQMNESYIALSVATDVSMSPMSGIAGGESTIRLNPTVTTDSISGYQLSVQASTAPAMQSITPGVNDSFADYALASSSSVPSFNFTIPTTASAFGFSPEGDDIISLFHDDGTTCGTGSLDTDGACWSGFSTTSQVVAQGGANQPNGATTDLLLRAQSGSDHIQTAGDYRAVITITAAAL